MDKPLISIVIPCYNIAPYIGKCLDTVLAQTYSNLEVICVNDGSKDATGAILDEYAQKDSRVKAIHKENGGVTSARFAALGAATGKWIGFVDGDDVIDEDMYERLMANVTDGVDISHCGFKKLLPDDSLDYVYNTQKKIEQDTRTGCKDLLEGTFIDPSLCNKLFRAELFDGLQDWLDVSIKINEDLLMNFYLFKKAKKSVYEDFCPYTYILRESSAAASCNRYKFCDPIRVMEVLIDELKEDEELVSIVKNKRAYFLIGAATAKNRVKSEEIRLVQRENRKILRSELKEILKSPYYGKRIKLTALWSCIWPASYTVVHEIYAKRNYKYKELHRKYKWL